MNVQERKNLIEDSYDFVFGGPGSGIKRRGQEVHVNGDVTLPDGDSQIPVLIDLVDGDFTCESDIKSLHNSPTQVNGTFFIRKVTYLHNLVGGPRDVANFSIMQGKIGSLEGLPPIIHYELSLPYQTNLGILRVLLVQNLEDFSMHNVDTGEIDETLGNIMARYLRKGWAAMVPCARELIGAGYRGMAKL